MLLQELPQCLLHLFYPSLCERCAKPLLKGEDVLCLGCCMEIPETGYHNIPDNDTALRVAGRIPFIYATSYAYFTADGILQKLLHALKYRNKKRAGRFLGRQFGHSLLEAQWNDMPDMIIAVPLHNSKLAQRGYNQSLIIAEGLSEVLNIPATDDLLLRIKETSTQTKKSREERVKNMESAFELKNAEQLKNKHILLIDDVLTTGATLESCALTLLKAENIKISVATVGIAVS